MRSLSDCTFPETRHHLIDIRVEFLCLGAIFPGACRVSQLVLGKCASHVGWSILRIESDHFVIIYNSLLKVVQITLGMPAIVVGVGKLWGKLNGFIVVCNSALIVARLVLVIPLVEIGLWRQIPYTRFN